MSDKHRPASHWHCLMRQSNEGRVVRRQGATKGEVVRAVIKRKKLANPINTSLRAIAQIGQLRAEDTGVEPATREGN